MCRRMFSYSVKPLQNNIALALQKADADTVEKAAMQASVAQRDPAGFPRDIKP